MLSKIPSYRLLFRRFCPLGMLHFSVVNIFCFSEPASSIEIQGKRLRSSQQKFRFGIYAGAGIARSFPFHCKQYTLVIHHSLCKPYKQVNSIDNI